MQCGNSNPNIEQIDNQKQKSNNQESTNQPRKSNNHTRKSNNQNRQSNNREQKSNNQHLESNNQKQKSDIYSNIVLFGVPYYGGWCKPLCKEKLKWRIIAVFVVFVMNR